MNPDSLIGTLRYLNTEALPHPLKFSEADLDRFSGKLNLTLPTDYRMFLLQTGGCFLSASCDILDEDTPLGSGVVIDVLYGKTAKKGYDLVHQNDEDANETLLIGSSLMGMPFYMICGGPEQGHVFCCDAQQRHLWPDEQFRTMFPALHPDISAWLDKRRQGKLKPSRAPFYLVARSFSDFLQSLKPEVYE